VHPITTYQGYIVELHRIPGNSSNPTLFPVILQTGLIGTSSDFVMASSVVSPDPTVIGQNLGIELAKQGYDVWLGNNRGNKYGMRHTNLSVESEEFWRFSFDQIAQFDTPTIVDFVVNFTGKGNLTVYFLVPNTPFLDQIEYTLWATLKDRQ